jgi:Tfp pilus assembly protein PilP
MKGPDKRLLRWPVVMAMSLAVVMCLSVPAHRLLAQSPAGAKPPAPAPSEVQPVPPPPVGQGYTYNPEGRRDPFVSLMNRGNDMRAPSVRPDGVGGVAVDEVALRGIVFSRAAYVAMIQAPDGKNYTIRPGNRLMDGTVKAITSDAVVFVQQVNDPLSLVKQREIRKPLRPTEEGK